MRQITFQLTAVIIAIACFAFKAPKPKAPPTDWVLLVFTGNMHSTADVTDESKYVEDPSFVREDVCLGADGGCAIVVTESSTSGSYPNRYLNSNSIVLGASPGSSGPSGGYYPYKAAGSGTLVSTYYKSE